MDNSIIELGIVSLTRIVITWISLKAIVSIWRIYWDSKK